MSARAHSTISGGRTRIKAAGAGSPRTATPARDVYLTALKGAVERPARTDADAALHAFLTLNAGYFLGEWLAPRAHMALTRRLAAALDGIADLEPPADAWHALQLAQHVRELAAEFGGSAWTARLIDRTAALVPDAPEDWEAAVGAATRKLAGGGDGHALLAAHARRRLWELAHASRATPSPSPPSRSLRATLWGKGALSDRSPLLPPSGSRAIAVAGLREGAGHTIQIVEAALAEIGMSPGLDSELRAALHALLGRVGSSE